MPLTSRLCLLQRLLPSRVDLNIHILVSTSNKEAIWCQTRYPEVQRSTVVYSALGGLHLVFQTDLTIVFIVVGEDSVSDDEFEGSDFDEATIRSYDNTSDSGRCSEDEDMH